MLEIVGGAILGIGIGMVSGLIPGVHVNTMAGVLLALQVPFLAVLGPLPLACALVAALVTHTFLDILPSTYLGVPDADTALSVLPAHALCLEGHAEEAVRISALGSATAVILGIPLALLFFLVLPGFQPYLDWWIGILLIAVIGILVITAESPGWSVALVLTSGVLGLFTFRYSHLAWHTFGGPSSLLLPLLSGLFGISLLLTSSAGRLPVQRFEGIQMEGKSIGRGALLGTCAGAIVGWLPGLSTAVANGLLATLIRFDHDRRSYILATSAANTANAFTGLAALYALSRMRNGVMVALATLELPPFSAMIAAAAVAAVCGYGLTVGLARSANRFNGLNIRWLNGSVILFVIVLSFLCSGPFGIGVLLLSTALGLVPTLLTIPRVPCMGAVMIPVIFFSLGIPL
jgi:putative membrane protein